MAVILHRNEFNRVDLYDISDIYDPNDASQTGPKFIPEVNSTVIDGGTLYYVVSVDPDTYESTLAPVNVVISDESQDNQISIEDYGNTVFACYYDVRNLPTKITIDSRLVVYGATESYQLIRNYQEDNEEIISGHYAANGDYISNRVPMIAVLDKNGNPTNVKYPRTCNTNYTITDNETITMVIHNAQSTVVATMTLISKEATILSSSTGNIPVITGLSVIGNQSRGNNEFYITQNQDINELALKGQLIYDDGTTSEVDVDDQKLFLYGTTDYFTSWIGLKQPIMMKYYLSRDEVGSSSIITNRFISADAYLVVTSDSAHANVKISVIPYWNPLVNAYFLKYFLYTVDRNRFFDVSNDIIISTGTFTGNHFGGQQSFTMQLNLNDVDNTIWPNVLIHSQNIVITLQPFTTNAARWILQDNTFSQIVYGAINPSAPRPIITYNSVVQRYRIPSSTFRISADFLTSFYEYGLAPYDATVESDPPTPTHFTIRDSITGATIITNSIAIDDYDLDITVSGVGDTDRYVDSTLVVEFLYISGADTNILYGVPVDVYRETI